MIDTFDCKEFEEALPTTVEIEHQGLVQGEYQYRLIINPDIGITIRSSINSNGLSGDVGQNSIRAWLSDNDGKPLGSKISKWVTRQPGWETRLLDTLRQLWKMAQFAGYCKDCHTPMGVFKVKKAGQYKGRIFKKCTDCRFYFQWMEE